MYRSLLFLLLLQLLFFGNIIANQNSDLWITHHDDIWALVINENESEVWVGTLNNGIYIYNGESWEILNTDNSSLPSNSIYEISFIDNETWIGTNSGLVIIRDDEWEVLNIDNSDLPSNEIWSISKGFEDTYWIGTRDGGLVKIYKDGLWKVLNESNSGIHNSVYDIVYDNQEVLFAGTGGGLFYEFDNNNWTKVQITDLPILALITDNNGHLWFSTQHELYFWERSNNQNIVKYDYNSSDLPSGEILSLSTDIENNIWIGVGSGLVLLKDDQFSHFNMDNSQLINNWVSSVFVDSNNNIWVGTMEGLQVHNPNGISTHNFQEHIEIHSIRLSQNYPNPFNPITTITFEIEQQSYVLLEIFNVFGQQIKLLKNNYYTAGSHSTIFDASHLPSGVYYYRMSTSHSTLTKSMTLLK